MFKNNKKKFNNLGFYIEYSLINPDIAYEFIEERSFIIRNIDRTQQSIDNIFKWTNTLDNKISNLLYIYIHLFTIGIYPFLNKELIIFDTSLIINIKASTIINNTYTYNEYTYQIAYIDSYIIDFIINNDYTIYYSLELNTNNVYKYTRSNKKLADEPFLYLQIDSNDNLSNNLSFNTSKLTNNFSFKLVPIGITDNYIYYKSNKQYILKTINTIKSLNNIKISIYDSTNKQLINKHINNNLYNNTYIACDCIYSDIKKASCYCSYIRHPAFTNNQIDIGFKIGTIHNQISNNVIL